MREKTIDLRDGELEPKRVEGGSLPAAIQDLDRPLPQEGPPFVIPGGPEREAREANETSETNKGGSR
jgi:hypothetical protein